MSLYRTEGVVLRTMRLGEADRIVAIATVDRGTVRAVVKGVRKTTSRFGARLEPLSHVQLQMWAGRGDLDIVTQAEVIDVYRAIREDLTRMGKAMVLLEVVDQVSQEAHANPQLYRMLVGGLRALQERDSALIVPSFLLKVLALDGSAPVLDRCAACGSDEKLVSFDLVEGGALCGNCRRGRAMSSGALQILRRILGGDLNRVLEEPAGTDTAEVVDLLTDAMEAHLDRRLRSVRSGPGA